VTGGLFIGALAQTLIGISPVWDKVPFVMASAADLSAVARYLGRKPDPLPGERGLSGLGSILMYVAISRSG
jgi:hypothetical protein